MIATVNTGNTADISTYKITDSKNTNYTADNFIYNNDCKQKNTINISDSLNITRIESNTRFQNTADDFTYKIIDRNNKYWQYCICL